MYDPLANYTKVAQTCNLFRNFIDVQDDFNNIMQIVNYFALNQVIYVLFITMKSPPKKG